MNTAGTNILFELNLLDFDQFVESETLTKSQRFLIFIEIIAVSLDTRTETDSLSFFKFQDI